VQYQLLHLKVDKVLCYSLAKTSVSVTKYGSGMGYSFNGALKRQNRNKKNKKERQQKETLLPLERTESGASRVFSQKPSYL